MSITIYKIKKTAMSIIALSKEYDYLVQIINNIESSVLKNDEAPNIEDLKYLENCKIRKDRILTLLSGSLSREIYRDLLKDCREFIYANFNNHNGSEAQSLMDRIDLLLTNKTKEV